MCNLPQQTTEFQAGGSHPPFLTSYGREAHPRDLMTERGGAIGSKSSEGRGSDGEPVALLRLFPGIPRPPSHVGQRRGPDRTGRASHSGGRGAPSDRTPVSPTV